MISENTYRYDLDLLKGLAIIAVVLYHAGWCKSGYLGVDVFFVINGYLVVPKVMNEIASGQFRYFRFLVKKLFRLLPLVLLVSAFALGIGYMDMLPFDFRFLSEEVVASSFFMNNILQSITTQNYWAAIYHKVMMHTWFLGVLFQFYIVFPLLMRVFRKWMKPTLLTLTVLSLILYIAPIDTIGDKYYLLQYRFFELSISGLIATKSFKPSSALSYLSFLGVLLMIFFGAFTIGERAMPYNLVGGTNTIRESFLPRELILILTVLVTVLFLVRNKQVSYISSFSKNSKILAPLGRMSLSIFLWHQPIFAFYRYFYADEISLWVLAVVVTVTLLLSFLTYYFIEKRIRYNKISRLCLLIAFVAINSFALWIYSIGGAVRDVPELDISKGNADPKVFERYTDRIYAYDKEFSSDSTKKKILVVGNSFARDFANILLESLYADSIQLSYRYSFDDCPMTRIRQCDRIYFFGWKNDVPDDIWRNLKSDADIWGIGSKNHGTSNGIFYKNRYFADYFDQQTTISEDHYAVDSLMKEEWKDNYINLLSLFSHIHSVPVFTPDHHFITYDCMHLTPLGAKYYSKLLMRRISLTMTESKTE
jgi:peptidoglycan/LPS O-acetylase OafA/YrhL